MPMKNPPHPGEVIRELYLEPLELTVTETARALGVARKTLSALLNGHSGISPEMAIRLSKAFGGSIEGWLQLQTNYDIAQTLAREEEIQVEVERLYDSDTISNDSLEKAVAEAA